MHNTVSDIGWSAGMLFGWETVMTFVLVSVVYAVAIGEPHFGIMGPFAVGLALFAMVFAGTVPLIPSIPAYIVAHAQCCNARQLLHLH